MTMMMTEEEWERLMVSGGVKRFEEQTRAQERSGRGEETVYAKRTIAQHVPALTEAIEQETIRVCGKNELGALDHFLRNTSLNAMDIATRALDVVHRRLFYGKTVSVAITLGRELEKDARGLQLDACVNIKDATERASARQEVHGTWQAWTEECCDRIGSELLGILKRTCGLIEEELLQHLGDKHPSYTIVPSEEYLAYRKDVIEEVKDTRPQYLPMIEPPQPWNSRGQRGGYLDVDRRFNLGLVMDEAHPAVLSTRVIEAVNTLQSTAWQINARVLEVMWQVWEQGQAIGKLPTSTPEKFGFRHKRTLATSNQDRQQLYKDFNAHLSREGKRRAAAAVLGVAEKCQGFEQIYFPHHLDFRGRCYAIPEHLTPQGPDYARALLRFVQGQPIGSHAAAGWLAVHGANCFGVKGTFEERHQWVYEHDDEILACAQNAHKHGWWKKADDPWQFLAFCFEWQGYDREGLAFVSRLPIALDGTCNGLQHYAALTKHEESMKAVNLMNPQVVVRLTEDEQDTMREANLGPVFADRGDEYVAPPQDLYQRVADEVAAQVGADDYLAWFTKWTKKTKLSATRVKQLRATKAEDAKQLQRFALDGTINRRMIKSHVMTLPYGKTNFGRWQTLEEYLTDRTESKTLMPLWKDVPAPVVTYLTERITTAINVHVPAAKLVMEWLTDVASEMASAKQPVTWETPSGLKVSQDYRNLDTRQIRMRARNSLSGKAVRHTLMKPRHEDDPIDDHKQVSAFPPNFIHSLDASHMMETVLLAKNQGITSFAMIHDSYATTAAQMDTLRDTLTATFRTIYQERDRLAELRNHVVAVLGETDVPPAPKRGDLKLGEMPFLFN